MLYYIVAIIVVLIDQIAKYLIRAYVEIGEILTHGNIHITHYENSGMAFSLFQGYARVFGVIAILFVVGIHYYRKSLKRNDYLTQIGLAFLVGGAVGNGLDRLLFGQVTDFITSRSGNGILNLADYAINIGCAVVIISSIYEWLKNKKKERSFQ